MPAKPIEHLRSLDADASPDQRPLVGRSTSLLLAVGLREAAEDYDGPRRRGAADRGEQPLGEAIFGTVQDVRQRKRVEAAAPAALEELRRVGGRQ